MLLRATWLAVCIWCIGLGGHLLWGWSLQFNLLSALALAVVGAAVALLLRPRLSSRAAARRLDRRFHLDEQLATAVEVATTNPPPNSIAARLVTQSGHTAALLHQRIARRQRPPWFELLTLIALGAVALGLSIMAGIGSSAVSGSPRPLPPLVAPQDPAQQFSQEQQPPGEQAQVVVPGNQGQAGPGNAPGESSTTGGPNDAGDPTTLRALAEALRDQGATRPAAEALDRGDLSSAAQTLRALADQAGQLSQDARNDLAERLRDAARQIEQHNQELADQLRQSANGLEQGGQSAAQALDDLARAIEQLQTGQSAEPGQAAQPGQQGQPGNPGQEQGGGEGQASGQAQGQGNTPGGAGNGPGGEQRQSNQSGRLGVEGQPVPLEMSGQGQVPAQPSGQPPTPGSGSSTGFTQGDASSGQRVQTGADPLRVPIDERDVVQDYFRP